MRTEFQDLERRFKDEWTELSQTCDLQARYSHNEIAALNTQMHAHRQKLKTIKDEQRRDLAKGRTKSEVKAAEQQQAIRDMNFLIE
jgi:predicted phage tail protein